MDLSSGAFWASLGSIVLANVVLSGDNAVVIAMAARALPPKQRTRAIVWGSLAAIVLRIALTLVAAAMLQWPYLKLVGALLLLCIGITLLRGDESAGSELAPGSGMFVAIRTILIADLVMSLDNVLAVAAAAQGDTVLLAIGLAVSVPLIVFGSTLLIRLMERLPFITPLGAALMGWLAGEMMLGDPAVVSRVGAFGRQGDLIAGAIGAVVVIALGLGLRRRKRSP